MQIRICIVSLFFFKFVCNAWSQDIGVAWTPSSDKFVYGGISFKSIGGQETRNTLMVATIGGESKVLYSGSGSYIDALAVSPDSKYAGVVEHFEPTGQRLVVISFDKSITKHVESVFAYTFGPQPNNYSYIIGQATEGKLGFEPTSINVGNLITHEQFSKPLHAFDVAIAPDRQSLFFWTSKEEGSVVYKADSELSQLQETSFQDIHFSPDGSHYYTELRHGGAFAVYRTADNINILPTISCLRGLEIDSFQGVGWIPPNTLVLRYQSRGQLVRDLLLDVVQNEIRAVDGFAAIPTTWPESSQSWFAGEFLQVKDGYFSKGEISKTSITSSRELNPDFVYVPVSGTSEPSSVDIEPLGRLALLETVDQINFSAPGQNFVIQYDSHTFFDVAYVNLDSDSFTVKTLPGPSGSFSLDNALFLRLPPLSQHGVVLPDYFNAFSENSTLTAAAQQFAQAAWIYAETGGIQEVSGDLSFNTVDELSVISHREFGTPRDAPRDTGNQRLLKVAVEQMVASNKVYFQNERGHRPRVNGNPPTNRLFAVKGSEKTEVTTDEFRTVYRYTFDELTNRVGLYLEKGFVLVDLDTLNRKYYPWDYFSIADTNAFALIPGKDALIVPVNDQEGISLELWNLDATTNRKLAVVGRAFETWVSPKLALIQVAQSPGADKELLLFEI